MTKPTHAWMIRAGNDNERADHLEAQQLVAIGWAKMGSLADLSERSGLCTLR